MNDLQLSNFLGELHVELKAKDRLRSKVLRKNRQTEIQTSTGCDPLRTEPTLQSDPVFMAVIALWKLHCEKFALSEGNRNDLLGALRDSFILGRKREMMKNNLELRERAAKATKGRRLIGSNSRSRVADTAQLFKHLSKEKASVAISNVVHLDAGTVRRYLTEIFPGNKWKE